MLYISPTRVQRTTECASKHQKAKEGRHRKNKPLIESEAAIELSVNNTIIQCTNENGWYHWYQSYSITERQYYKNTQFKQPCRCFHPRATFCTYLTGLIDHAREKQVTLERWLMNLLLHHGLHNAHALLINNFLLKDKTSHRHSTSSYWQN